MASVDSDTKHPHVCQTKWLQVLERAAGHLRNKQLLKTLSVQTDASTRSEDQNVDQQEAGKDLEYGERQRLRDIFCDLGASERDKNRSHLFINKQQLKVSLAKMGCAMRDDTQEQEVLQKKDPGKTTRTIRRGICRRGDRTSENSAVEDRMEDLQKYTVSLWSLEREVERSRLVSTFEQMKLHQIFGDALSDEMQPQKGICTPLAIEQLQSEHLMSWMLSLGKDRLRELLGRAYDLKRGDIVERMLGTILDFHTKQESQSNAGSNQNSKYSTWAGTFAGKTRKATFGKLEDFKKGLDSHIGMPSTNIKQQMRREHCHSHDSHIMFSPPNNPDIYTCPADEYDYVINFDPTKEYPGGSDRRGGVLQGFIKHPNAKKSGLTEEEAAALRLYSGPMYIFYNLVLRGGEKKYITTIHAIVSGIIKLASIMKLPFNRKVYRGLSGFELPEEFWNEDEYGAKGGVEFGIMSTTTNKKIAVQYSSHGRTPTIFEIEIGQVDRGAELGWISVRN